MIHHRWRRAIVVVENLLFNGRRPFIQFMFVLRQACVECFQKSDCPLWGAVVAQFRRRQQNRSGNNTTTDLCDDFFFKRFLFDNVGTAVPTNFLHDGRVWSEFGERVPNRSFFGTNKLMDENTTELYIGIVPRKLYCYKVIVDYGYLLNNLS